MIQELKDIVARVDALNLFQYTNWYLGQEIPRLPAFVLDRADKFFEPLDATAKIYNARLTFWGFILAKMSMDDAAFDDLVDKTLKELASNPNYAYAELQESVLDVLVIEEYEIKAVFFKMEYLRRENLV